MAKPMIDKRSSPCVSAAARCKGAETYRHVCARLGQQPSPEITCDLWEHGALIADLRLCREEVETICAFLREAPAGVHQLVLYDGRVFFGADRCYCVKLRAVQKRTPCTALCNEPLRRQLLMALEVLCSVRGGGVAVLELTGLPLGRHMQHLTTFARCLPHLHSLQRLHLGGCNMSDCGLAALLPHLANRLPKLSHLSLARNNLQSVGLVARLLKGRAAAQQKRRAVPLNIFDLSENPYLGARPAEPSKLLSSLQPIPLPAPTQRGRSIGCGGGDAVDYFVPTTRKALLGVVCDALREGLILRTLRVRSMALTRDDLCPLLRFLVGELSRLEGGAAVSKDLSLSCVSLEGNPLEQEFPAAINQTLQQLTNSGSHTFGRECASGCPEARPDACQQPQAARSRSL